MRVLFVDVGQGTCQIILLGGGRAIVIDAGANSRTAHRILKINRIDTIELLAVSHSHFDHAGGVVTSRKKKVRSRARQSSCSTGILVDYQNAIKQIGFVQDIGFLKSHFGQYLVKLLNENRIDESQLVRLERTNRAWPLWPPDATQGSTTVLACISPTAAGNILANQVSNENAASAIIELRHHEDRILFTGDSEYGQWNSLHEHRLKQGLTGPIKCKVMTMPHHGGLMQGDAKDLQRFSSDITNAEVVVFSVGTTNGHNHPRPEVVAAMRKVGAHVVCTQITSQCCSDLATARPAIIGQLIQPCQSSSKPDYAYRTKKKAGKNVRYRRNRNVACAGTVSAILDENGIRVERIKKHAKGVDALAAAGNHPMCRDRAD